MHPRQAFFWWTEDGPDPVPRPPPQESTGGKIVSGLATVGRIESVLFLVVISLVFGLLLIVGPGGPSSVGRLPAPVAPDPEAQADVAHGRRGPQRPAVRLPAERRHVHRRVPVPAPRPARRRHRRRAEGGEATPRVNTITVTRSSVTKSTNNRNATVTTLQPLGYVRGQTVDVWYSDAIRRAAR